MSARVLAVFGLVLLLGIGLFARPHAQAQSPGSGVVQAPIALERAAEHGGPLPLGRHVSVLRDPTGALGIDDVASPALAGRFVPGTRDVVTLGLTRDAIWLRTTVERGASQAAPAPWLVEVAMPIPEHVDLYSVWPDGSVHAAHSGRLVPLDEWPIFHRFPALPVALSPAGTTELFVRVVADEAMIVPLRLWRSDVFETQRFRDNLFYGFFYGGLAALVLYHLMVFSFARDRRYLYYSLAIGGYALYQSINDGFAPQYLWPDWPWWRERSLDVLGIAMVIPTLGFARSFIGLERHAPRIDGLVPWCMGAVGVMVVWGAFGDNHQFLPFTMAVVAGASLVVLAGTLTALRNGSKEAGFFLAALVVVGVLAQVKFAEAFGWVETSWVVRNTVPLSVFVAAALFSIPLSGRIRDLSVSLTGTEAEKAEVLAELRHLNETLDRGADAFLSQPVARPELLKRVQSLLRIHELHETVRSQAGELERAHAAQATFLATASHDLRQPIHALGLFVDALAERRGEVPAAGLVDRIQASTRGLEEMLDSLLDLSRLDCGSLVANPSTFPLRVLFDRLRAEFEPDAARQGLRLGLVPTSLQIHSDPVLLERILRNLLTNALRYTARGGVVIGARRRGDEVWIEVWDSGRGIEPEEQQRIFREFERLRGAEQAAEEGLGLGLSIVQRLCALLEHDLAVDSEPGRGSVFRIRVPRVAVARLAPAAPSAPTRTSLEGVVVAVVDDDTDILDGMRTVLESQGARVVAGASTEEVVKAVHHAGATPDAILADYQLARDETGLDTIDALRKAADREIPALILTGETQPEILERIERSGFPHLRKPASPIRLRAALEHLLGRGGEPDGRVR